MSCAPPSQGVFVERPDDPHRTLRHSLLQGHRALLDPPPPVPAAARDPLVTAAAAEHELARQGMALVALDRPMTNDELLRFGGALGDPQVERSADVQPRVDDGVILNVTTELPPTADPALQPFAAGSLTLHSERSRVPLGQQPRYVVLMCIAPGPDPARGRTLLVSMADVAARLTDAAREILMTTSFATTGSSDRPGGAPVLRGPEPVISFRDFLDEPQPYRRTASTASNDGVREAVVELLMAMYSAPATGVSWERGLLLAIDNTRHLHGKTVDADPLPGRLRRLKRLRIGKRAAR